MLSPSSMGIRHAALPICWIISSTVRPLSSLTATAVPTSSVRSKIPRIALEIPFSAAICNCVGKYSFLSQPDRILVAYTHLIPRQMTATRAQTLTTDAKKKKKRATPTMELERTSGRATFWILPRRRSGRPKGDPVHLSHYHPYYSTPLTSLASPRQ